MQAIIIFTHYIFELIRKMDDQFLILLQVQAEHRLRQCQRIRMQLSIKGKLT